MHSVVINGKKFSVEDNAPLKETLVSAGFYFPCGGSGKCGKCRINCPSLPITDLDKRFLSENMLSDGVRLACDKSVTSSLEIQCEISEKNTDIVLRECSVAVTVFDEEISVCIVGEEPVETVTKSNPLAPLTAEELAEAYGKNPSEYTNALRAVIGKESVELFEKYGSAKAVTTAVAAKGLYLKILAGLPLEADLTAVEEKSENDNFGLPTESLFILPAISDFIGGEILAETVLLKERSLLIDCEKTVVMFGVGDEDDIATAIWDCDYSDIATRCIKAAAKFMVSDMTSPIIYLCGRYADKVEDALNEIGLATVQKEKRMENTVNALLSFRVRSKLLKEKNRTTAIKIYDNEAFQNFLVDL